MDDNLDITVRVKDSATRSLKTTKRSVDGLGSSVKKTASGFKGLYAQLIAISGVLAGGALFSKAVRDFAAFDDNMRAAAAVTKATTQELAAMTEMAKEMGRTTRYTASQAAEALRFLGMAGLEATEATEALPGVLNLAAAGALDLGTAADITTNVLSAFGLEVSQLSRVNDVLVQTFTNSNVTLTEIGEAFKMVGPIAKGVGANFEDLVGTIGALGNAGIKGTLAGTALKNAIDALLAPTGKEAELMKQFAQRIGQTSLQVRDSQGDFIGFARIIEQIEKAGAKGDEILQAFGMRAGPGLAALMNMGTEELQSLINKLNEAGGVSQEVADKMEAGIGGEIRKTISVWEAFKLALGEALGPSAIKLMESFRNTLNRLIDLIKELDEGGEIQAFGDMVVTVFEKIDFAISKTYRLVRVNVALYSHLFGKITGDAGLAEEALKGLNEEMRVLTGAADPDVVSIPFTDAMRKELEEMKKDDGPIGKGSKEVGDDIANNIIQYPTMETNLKVALIKLKAILKEESEKIKGEYAEGLIDIVSYYDQRAEIVRKKIEAELAILRNAAASQEDVDKKAIINAQIFAKEQELSSELLKLRNERKRAEEKIERDFLKKEQSLSRLKIRAERSYNDQKSRIKEEGLTELEVQFGKEEAALQAKHAKELQAIREYNEAALQLLKDKKASEEEIERQTAENKARINEQRDLQTAEKAQMIADQQVKLREYQIQNLQQLAQGATQIFTQLYNLTGQQSKELFYLAKAAAIAEATMNVAQGVTKAMAQGGIWGIAQGAIIAAQGAVQISTIAAQGLADGGEVLGVSPSSTADDKLIAATSGEFMEPVSSVKYYGLDFMEAIRKKAIPREAFSGYYASGGGISKPSTHFANGGPITQGAGIGPSGKPEINIINITDQSQIDAYLASSRGQDAVINVMGSRPDEVRRILREAY